MDPVVDTTLRMGLSLLFLAAASHKVGDLRRFRATLVEYHILPRRVVPASAVLVVAAEVALAVLLLVPAMRAPALLSAAALLGLYGGAIALNLALERPPAGLILQSTFTSIRDLARHHYPLIPPLLIPDWYPSLSTIARLQAPLLLMHGDRDDIAPLSHAHALYDAAPPPKRIHVLAGRGHNDLVAISGTQYGALIAQWASELVDPAD